MTPGSAAMSQKRSSSSSKSGSTGSHRAQSRSQSPTRLTLGRFSSMSNTGPDDLQVDPWGSMLESINGDVQSVRICSIEQKHGPSIRPSSKPAKVERQRLVPVLMFAPDDGRPVEVGEVIEVDQRDLLADSLVGEEKRHRPSSRPPSQPAKFERQRSVPVLMAEPVDERPVEVGEVFEVEPRDQLAASLVGDVEALPSQLLSGDESLAAGSPSSTLDSIGRILEAGQMRVVDIFKRHYGSTSAFSGNGALDEHEMHDVFARIGLMLPLTTIRSMILALDIDGDGRLDIIELELALRQRGWSRASSRQGTSSTVSCPKGSGQESSSDIAACAGCGRHRPNSGCGPLRGKFCFSCTNTGPNAILGAIHSLLKAGSRDPELPL